MNEDCRHFQSRTYSDGEVARFCVLNLAPEAPWRCPDACPRYEKDIIVAAGFDQGSLVRPEVEEEPDEPPGEIAELLDEADSIVTAAGPEIVAEIEAEREGRSWWKFWKRRPGRPDGGNGPIELSNR